MTGKVVLAYSGGLDTSIIIPWLRERHDAEVVAYCGDVGQDDDLAAVLNELSRVLTTGGLVQVGLWEGPNQEGPWDTKADAEVARFFALRTDQRVKELFGARFSIESFVSFLPPESDLTYQLMRLRKP